jgi:hypothetical protein
MRMRAWVLPLMLLTGCVAHTEPAELFQPTVEASKHRAMQIRFFETPNETNHMNKNNPASPRLFPPTEYTRKSSSVPPAIHCILPSPSPYVSCLTSHVL